HPMVASATIARIPPGTVRLIVTEKSPVALVQEDALGLATTTGEILPLDPTLHALDLPIVRGTRADSASAAVLQRLLTETQRLVTLDPLLMAEISEIDTFSADPDALVLLHPDAKIVLPFG